MTDTSSIAWAGRRRSMVPFPCRLPSRSRGAGRAAVLVATVLLATAVPATGPARAEAGAVAGGGTMGEFRPTFDPSPAFGARKEPIVVPTLPLPGGWPAVEIRTLLVAMHLLGLCFGLGGATMLDFWILRWIWWGYLPDNVVRTFEFVAKAVSAGLVLLWLSGFGLLTLFWLYDPAKLANPKILAKVLVVGALSINGVAIHRLVLPYVAQSCAMPLFDGFRRRSRLLFILSGALSGVSWYFAFSLGLLHEFNGRVSAAMLLGVWLTLFLLSAAVLEAMLGLIRYRDRWRSGGSGIARPPHPARPAFTPGFGHVGSADASK